MKQDLNCCIARFYGAKSIKMGSRPSQKVGEEVRSCQGGCQVSSLSGW